MHGESGVCTTCLLRHMGRESIPPLTWLARRVFKHNARVCGGNINQSWTAKSITADSYSGALLSVAAPHAAMAAGGCMRAVLWLLFLFSPQLTQRTHAFGEVKPHSCDLLVSSPTGRRFLYPLHSGAVDKVLAAADIDGHTIS